MTTPTLIVDTLIMDNRSKLIFTLPLTRIYIRHAIIGKKCEWIGRGEPKIKDGTYITRNGRSMEIDICFKELGRLTIDVRGATGHRGAMGRQGTPGMNGGVSTADGSPGGNGGQGGDGGDGGNITFRYQTLGDPVVFSKARKNAVVFKLDGGSGGPGGQGGPGGPGGRPVMTQYESAGKKITEFNGQQGATGRMGNTGFAGDNGKPGTLVVTRIP